jgi:hypothetical protein
MLDFMYKGEIDLDGGDAYTDRNLRDLVGLYTVADKYDFPEFQTFVINEIAMMRAVRDLWHRPRYLPMTLGYPGKLAISTFPSSRYP